MTTTPRTTARLAFWLCLDFALMLLSVYRLHSAWYLHREGSVLVWFIAMMIWMLNFRADIRRWK